MRVAQTSVNGWRTRSGHTPCARCCESTEVQKVSGRTRTRERISHQIRPLVELAGVVEIVIVQHTKRHASRQRDYSAHAPPPGQHVHAMRFGNSVVPEPAKALPHIESGITALMPNVEAVIGLRLEGSVVLAATGGVVGVAGG